MESIVVEVGPMYVEVVEENVVMIVEGFWFEDVEWDADEDNTDKSYKK